MTSTALSYPWRMGPRCALWACEVSPVASYGVRVSRIGARRAPFGTRMTVCSLTPSRIGIITFRRVKSYSSAGRCSRAGVSLGSCGYCGCCAVNDATHVISAIESRLIISVLVASWLAPSPEPRVCSQLRQRDAALRLVLALLVLVRLLARFVALEEQHLCDAFVGVNLCRQRRRIRDLDRHVPFPFRLERRHVDDDPAARVGRLAEAHGEDVARDAEVLDRARQRERVRRDDALIGDDVDERFRIERLRIDDRVVDVGEDLELVADADVVAVGGDAVGDHAGADLIVDEGLDHLVLPRHPLDPAIRLDAHRLKKARTRVRTMLRMIDVVSGK